MKTFKDYLAENRRLTILLVLEQADGYRLNEFILQPMLEQYGFNVSANRLHTDLAWLAEQELVTVETVSDVQIATATRRGVDIALGRSVVPGVKRPAPRS